MRKRRREVLCTVKKLLEGGKMNEAALSLKRGDLFLSEPIGKKGKVFWREVAIVFRDVGLVDEAEIAWRKAGEAGLPQSIVEKAVIVGRVLKGMFAEALEGAQSLVESMGRNPVNSALYAIALLENGRVSDAVKEWQRRGKMAGEKHSPLPTETVQIALTAMAVERFLSGRENEVARKEVSSKDGTGAPMGEKAPRRTFGARLRMMDKAANAGNYEQALAWIKAEKQSGHAWRTENVMFLEAQVLAEMGKWNRSRQTLGSLIGKEGGDKSLEAFYAYCLLRCGEANMALQILQRQGIDGPDDYFVNYFRGCAWLTLGDRTRAFWSFRIAFQRFFFDTYHLLFVRRWQEMARLTEGEEESAGKVRG